MEQEKIKKAVELINEILKEANREELQVDRILLKNRNMDLENIKAAAACWIDPVTGKISC
ncbi:hypothetical protein [Muricauda sp. MAR_2010_75]|jgi:hypothetical protein|uniref:hypothetical protein n=1 Tax=Allomuricauda sp. MAR_2010_75 TaxID=1250232 RepID=UPI0005647E82|nr:hypothetical protein [Muricauda sp. MAR_2010_75]